MPPFRGVPGNQGRILASVKNYERQKRASEPNTYDGQTDITEFKGEAEYTLRKLICRRISKRGVSFSFSSIDGDTQNPGDKEDLGSKQFVSDTLRAKINFSKQHVCIDCVIIHTVLYFPILKQIECISNIYQYQYLCNCDWYYLSLQLLLTSDEWKHFENSYHQYGELWRNYTKMQDN